MDKGLEKALRKVPLANKYRAKRSGSALFGGRMFDSKAERDRAEILKALEQDGRIKAKLWSCYGPGPLRITKRKSVKAGFQVTKTIYIKSNEQLDKGSE